MMIDYYPLLVETCIEFKRFSRKYLADKKGKVNIPGVKNLLIGCAYEDRKSARTTELAKGYVLELNPAEDKFYCLKDGQTRKSEANCLSCSVFYSGSTDRAGKIFCDQTSVLGASHIIRYAVLYNR